MEELKRQKSSSLSCLIIEEECLDLEYLKGLLEINDINVHTVKNKEGADKVYENGTSIDLVVKIYET